MQKNDRAQKRRLLFDGDELPGLVETSDLTDEEEGVDVPSFNRTRTVGSGVSKLEPLDVIYKDQKGTKTRKFLTDWKFKKQVKDVVVINTDSTGFEINRWLWPDCECLKYNERGYTAAGVEFAGINVVITCTGTPVPLTE